MKISEIELPPIIGVMGVARSGKDTFCKLANIILSKNEKCKIMRAGFADSVKGDLHRLLVEKVGISAYTEIPDEKELIRPLMVEYGTNLMRKINEDVWINRMKPNLDLAKTLNACLCITDVRYENEALFIKGNGGNLVYVEQEGCEPINEEEEKNDPRLRLMADVNIKWEKVGDDKILSLKPKVTKALKVLSCNKK